MLLRRKLLQVTAILVILSILFSGVSMQPALAQDKDGLKRELNSQTGKVSFLGPESGSSLPAAQALGIASFSPPTDPALALAKRFGAEFGLQSPERDLSPSKTHRTENGRITAHYQQTYQGIPVIGGELIVNTNDHGDLYSMNGEVSPNLSLSTQLTLDSETAKQTALGAVAKWYQESTEAFQASEPELWIFDESLLQPSSRPAELVWRVEVTPQEIGMPVRELVLVNAQRGNVSLHFNQIDNAWSGSERNPVQGIEPTPTPPPTATPEPPVTELPTAEGSSLDAFSGEVGPLAPTTWYVAPSGLDSNSCSSAGSPCGTIDGAIAKAGSGDTIRVAGGTYTGTSGNVVTVSKSLTLSGGWNSSFAAQNDVSIIDGGGARNGILANATGSTVIVEYFVIQNSYTVMDSGGIYVFGANFTLKNSSVINNKATKGAGIFIINNASLTVLNSTISGNAATSSGGGVYIVDGTVTINNSTLASNSSSNVGGGLTKEGGTISIKNSILAKNTAAGSSPDCSGSINSSDHNIIGNTSGCTVSNGSGDRFNIDPSINALSGTLPVHALKPNSPAINAGDSNTCLPIDQRGMPRPYGSTCDIGAYEYSAGVGLIVAGGSDQTAKINSAFALPLSVYLLDSAANPVAGATITFTAPASGASGTFATNGTNVTTAVTDSRGFVSSPIFTANNQEGSYTITAAAGGYSYSTTFSLRNSGNNYYVSPSGSDSNPCDSPALPCLTINGAIGKASNGDTIRVATGTYTGTGLYVVTIGSGLTLSGGWNNTFSVQNGFSTIDGQNVRPGISAGGTPPGSTIDHFIITNGYARSGGGGITSSGWLTVNNSVIINNKGEASTGSAGGIYAYHGSLTLNNTTIRGNFAASQGGGILVSGEPALIINNSTIAENQSINYGGGIVFAGGSGGAVQITTITNSTIVNNTATASGGINIQGWSPGRVVNIKNSLIARNSSKINGPDCWGTINLLEYSLLGVGNNCTVASGTGNLINIDPRTSDRPVGPLGYYPLQMASPAIDKGANCLPADQRGVSRPQGNACDIGAYEFTVPGAAASLGIISGSNQHAGTLLPFSKPLAVYVVDALGSPVGGAGVTFTAPATGASGTFADSGTYSTTAITDDNGWATASTFTANSQNGTYNVTATASGLPGSASFLLTNATWYVSSSGNNTNSCTSPGAPCLTINGAIAKASDSDIIKVASGTYSESSSPVVNITKSLILSGGWNPLFTSRTGKSIVDGGGINTGVILNDFNQVTISNFIVRNGTDGIANHNGTLTFENSALINNKNGLSNRGEAMLINTTISGNHASTSAGSAIGNLAGTVKISYSTITNNSGYYDYAIWSVNGSAFIEIGNSILAKNGYRDCEGNIISLGNNIFGFSPPCLEPFPIQPTDKVGVDPKLLPLHPGGFHPSFPDGPEINAANSASCPAIDQRDAHRPVGSACDIGAYEYVGPGTIPAYITPYAGTPQNIVLGAVTTNQLKAVVFDEKGDVVPGATLIFSAPGSGASGTFSNTNLNTATVTTDTYGIASSPPLKANSVPGTYTVNATVAGITDPAGFSITNIQQVVRTYSARNSYSLPGLDLLCMESNPNCTNGSNPRADKAHFYAIGTVNFYLNKHNRGGIDNHGMTIISTVDYCPNDVRIPCPYANAFWNGEQMVYGSAYGFALADDVVAHELTHGVTQYGSNLFPYYQSGAIGESLSDLWGEYYDQMNGQGNDAPSVKWLVGEDVSGLSPIRNMSNPPAYGDPDRMSSANYRKDNADSGGIHHNSGVNNKAVSLLVDGGSFNGKTITALGWDKTAAIYYEANTNLLSSGADYSDLYYAVQQACINLIGQKGITTADCMEVKGALDAVEMYGQPTVGFNTDAPYCELGTPTMVFSDDLEMGTGNWTFTNGSYLRWQWDSPYGPYAQSGLHSLYADDYPAANSDTNARLKSFAVSANSYLRFAQAYGFETGYLAGNPTFHNFDGGVLEYSINNGATWIDAGSLIDMNGYTGVISMGTWNPLEGRSGFVGSSHGYISTRLNLSSLTGQTVSFRWRMGLDESTAAWGWWVDNVQIYTCPVILSKDTTGVFRPTNGLLYLKNTNTTGFADAALNYGLPGDYPVVGDWDGNGTVTIGIYRQGYFYLKQANTLGFADNVFAFGKPGDQPIAGDWNGDGVDTIGVFNRSTGHFLLRNSNTEGPAEMDFYLGNPGDVGIAGDWDGDGKDTTGVFRPSNGLLYLKNKNETGFADAALNYGLPGDMPVTGDWDNDGIDTIGVYRQGQFMLRNSNTIGFAEIIFGLGNPGDMPIAGNWDALP